MKILGIILASLAIATGVLGTLCLLVIWIAASPNSSPQQEQLLKMFMLASALGGLLCLVGGVVLLVFDRPISAGVVGAMPMIALLAGGVWLSFKSAL